MQPFNKSNVSGTVKYYGTKKTKNTRLPHLTPINLVWVWVWEYQMSGQDVNGCVKGGRNTDGNIAVCASYKYW